MWKVLLIGVAVVLGTYRVLVLRRRNVSVVTALGFSLDNRPLLNGVIGFVIGSMAVAVIFLIAWWSKLLVISRIGPASAMIEDFSTFIMVQLIEETMFRCAILGALLLLITRRSLAIIMAAVVFGGLHALNPNSTMLSVLITMLGGLAYSIAYAATERIWLPFGLHCGWNYAQARIFGFPVSGYAVLSPAPLIQQVDLGPALITGGAYGPEGGLMGLGARLLVLASIAVWLKVISSKAWQILE